MAGRFRPRRRGLVALSAAAGLLVVGWLATTPWLVDHWPRVLAVVLFLFVFVVPRWFVPARSAASLARSRGPGGQGPAGGRPAEAAERRPHRAAPGGRRGGRDRRRGGDLAAAGDRPPPAPPAAGGGRPGAGRRALRPGPRPAGQRAAGRPPRRHLRAGAGRRPGLGGGPGRRRRLPAAAGVLRGDRRTRPRPRWWASQDRVQVFEILSAYVRTTSHRPPVGPAGRCWTATRRWT